MPPHYIDVFLSPIRDNQVAQVALFGFMLLVLLDIALGLAQAAKSGALESSKMREGLWHKTGELACVVIADIIDGMLLGGIDLGYDAPVSTGIIVLLCVNEILSCMENAALLNPDLRNGAVFKLLESSHAIDPDAKEEG